MLNKDSPITDSLKRMHAPEINDDKNNNTITNDTLLFTPEQELYDENIKISYISPDNINLNEVINLNNLNINNDNKCIISDSAE